jgi:ubiquinone/menaquinone biosynthesis C-methylase UbiE
VSRLAPQQPATIASIADLRSADPDPYMSAEEDTGLALALDACSAEHDLAGLLREHWRLVGKPPHLAVRFTAHDLAAGAKSEEVVRAVEAARGGPLGPGDRVLEVGCGSAALAAAAARRGAEVTATDVSLRWLVLARKRLAEEGVAGVRLACCAAEEEVFEPASFDLVLASDVIEHVVNPDAFVAGCARVLRPGGLLFLATPNRYSLGLEPHVRLPLVGYLPRGLARRYVWAVRKAPYDHVRLLSARDLRHLLQASGLEAEIVAPEIPEASERLYRGVERELVRGYNCVRRFPAAQATLIAVGPLLHVFARKLG